MMMMMMMMMILPEIGLKRLRIANVLVICELPKINTGDMAKIFTECTQFSGQQVKTSTKQPGTDRIIFLENPENVQILNFRPGTKFFSSTSINV